MKPWKLLLIILLAAVLIGCLVSPFIYWGMGKVAPSCSVAASLYGRDFHRFLNRCIMISGVVLVAIWWRPLIKGRPRSLGLERGPHWKGQLAGGFLFGVVSLIIFTFIMIICDARRIYLDSTGKIITGVLSALITCAIVGFLEEVFFRGFFMGSIMEKGRVAGAVIISSAFYSILHFFKLKEGLPPEGLDIFAGFKTLGAIFASYADPLVILPGFVGLFLLGVVLAMCYIWTGSLYFGIGLHAGLVFIIQADGRFLSKGMAMLDKRWLYGGSDYVTGVTGWVFLIVAVFAIRLIITRKGWKVG